MRKRRLVLVKRKENLENKIDGFFSSAEPLKSLEKKGKNQKNEEILTREKNKEIPKQKKEGQGWEHPTS